MLPAQRRHVREQGVIDDGSSIAQCLNGSAKIDGVPKDDRGHDKIEAAGSILPPIESSVAEPTESVEADGPGQAVARLSLVELDRRFPPKLRIFQPVQGEKRSFDSPDFAEGHGQPILPRIGAEAFEHQRRRDMSGPDGGREAQHFVPMIGDELFIEPASDKGFKSTSLG